MGPLLLVEGNSLQMLVTMLLRQHRVSSSRTSISCNVVVVRLPFFPRKNRCRQIFEFFEFIFNKNDLYPRI